MLELIHPPKMKNFTQKFIGLFALVLTMTFSLSAQNSCDFPAQFSIVTGQNMTVMLSESFINQLPELNENAYIVAHASNSGIIVGSTSLNEGEMSSLAIWGDDNFTTTIDGAQDGEAYWLQLVNGNSVYNINDVVYQMGSNIYQANGIAMITSSSFELYCSVEDSPVEEQIDYTIDDPCTSLSDYNSILVELNPIQSRSFNEGWNMFGFPCKESRSVSEAFAEIESDLYIIKNNEGSFYWPEFDFDGIVDLIPLEGYLTKLYNSVSDFSFCETSTDFPNVSGCTDCESLNFNPFATIDDGSCIESIYGCTYDLYFNFNSNATIDDGSCVPYVYGCIDPLYLEYDPNANTLDVLLCETLVVEGCLNPLYLEYNPNANTPEASFCLTLILEGCTDINAINFNSDANVDNGTCVHLIEGCTDPDAINYNADADIDDQSCQYQLQIGDSYEGGIIFYLDGSGEHGLVASEEDITEGAYSNGFRTGFPWGCSGQDYTGAEGTALFTGYQNSQFIVDFSETQNCSSPSGSVSAAEKCLNYNHNGYDDWYLPSKETLLLMSTNIGPGPNGSYGNIGNFVVGESYWSSSEGDVNLNTAWSVIFYDYNSSISGTPSDTGKNNLFSVRAVRSF